MQCNSLRGGTWHHDPLPPSKYASAGDDIETNLSDRYSNLQ